MPSPSSENEISASNNDLAKNLPEEGKAKRFVNWLVEKGLSGPVGLASSKELAQEYLLDKGYKSNDHRVDALIRWEMSKNFTSGFISGLGGAITLPIAIPVSIGCAWLLQARMVGSIACIYGHNLASDRVRTMILLSVLGENAVKEVLKGAGVQVGKSALNKAIMSVPGRALIEVNKRVGMRLITKAGEKGIVNLIKFVPLAGGVIGGSVDLVWCRAVGKTAKKLFQEQNPAS